MQTNGVPVHLGFILDGNRRWARRHSIPEMDGHLAGYNALIQVVEGCFEARVQYVTIYAFSSENWNRNTAEVSSLMKLALRALSSDVKRLVKNQVRVRFLGSHEGLSEKLISAMRKAEAATESFRGRTLAVCFNYGGQQEIVEATKRCIADGLLVEDIDETAISERLFGADIPAIDMVIRTSGEQRLSNFMIWRTAYSELLFLEKYWPDMTKQDVTAIIDEYNRRSRRYGV